MRVKYMRYYKFSTVINFGLIEIVNWNGPYKIYTFLSISYQIFLWFVIQSVSRDWSSILLQQERATLFCSIETFEEITPKHPNGWLWWSSFRMNSRESSFRRSRSDFASFVPLECLQCLSHKSSLKMYKVYLNVPHRSKNMQVSLRRFAQYLFLSSWHDFAIERHVSSCKIF